VKDILGSNVFLKLESRQESGSFKIHGAANKIFKLSVADKSLGVITVSSGYLGQGVSCSAHKLTLSHAAFGGMPAGQIVIGHLILCDWRY
jgi:threonine dehydratase